LFLLGNVHTSHFTKNVGLLNNAPGKYVTLWARMKTRGPTKSYKLRYYTDPECAAIPNYWEVTVTDTNWTWYSQAIPISNICQFLRLETRNTQNELTDTVYCDVVKIDFQNQYIEMIDGASDTLTVSADSKTWKFLPLSNQ
jgi:hypothetical protein